MSKWITHRRPTEEDANYGDVHLNGYVYVTDELGMTTTATWKAAAWKGVPWQPFCLPKPYVKPKRWTIEWDGDYRMWFLADRGTNKQKLPSLHSNDDECRIIAEKIAEIYNEEMP